MLRSTLAALFWAAFLVSACAPLNPRSESRSDPFRYSGGGAAVYSVQVLNLDWDAKHLWFYCDGALSLKLDDLALQEVRTGRLRDANCTSISFRTEGQGGKQIFRSPELPVPPGATLEVTLRESARHTTWRWSTKATR